MDDKKTAVITGASSGIGRETAFAFARSGYNVVLIARRREELDAVAKLCQDLGAKALVGNLDTNDETALQNLSDKVSELFGPIDVWVNNAGVYVAGRLDEIPSADVRRIMDTNFFGYVNGSRTALLRFKAQGFGTLINVSSVNAVAPQPYGAPYAASKAAVRALDESIRMELRLDGLSGKIHVCTVLPSPVDTNIYRNSANYTGKELLAVEPVYSATHVAARIVEAAKYPRREIYIGRAGRLFALQHSVLPGLYERTTALYTKADVLGKTPAADTPGNLYQPIESHRGSDGGWRSRRVKGELVDTAIAVGLVSVGALAALGTAFALTYKKVRK